MKNKIYGPYCLFQDVSGTNIPIALKFPPHILWSFWWIHSNPGISSILKLMKLMKELRIWGEMVYRQDPRVVLAEVEAAVPLVVSVLVVAVVVVVVVAEALLKAAAEAYYPVVVVGPSQVPRMHRKYCPFGEGAPAIPVKVTGVVLMVAAAVAQL